MTANGRFLIDQILPIHDIHVISGPAGIGKSTLMLQILSDWAGALPVFSHLSTPAPYALVSCDRAQSAIDATMTRIGIIPSIIPHFSIIDPTPELFRRRESSSPADDDHSLPEILAVCQRLVPGLSLLVIDGLPELCKGKIIDHHDVSTFLREASRLCQRHHITILGTVYAAKSRDGEGYSAPCDRMLGSGAWASHTGTKFILERGDDTLRTLHVLPQNFAPEAISLMHDPDNGRLVPYVEPAGVSRPALDKWIAELEPGTPFTTQMVQQVGKSFGISARTVTRWIEDQLAIGTIHRIDRGEYRTSANGGINN